jgi:hypothetical protein
LKQAVGHADGFHARSGRTLQAQHALPVFVGHDDNGLNAVKQLRLSAAACASNGSNARQALRETGQGPPMALRCANALGKGKRGARGGAPATPATAPNHRYNKETDMTQVSTQASHRTPAEVFADHGRRLGTGDLDSISANYARDAVFITPQGILRGKDGVKKGIGALLADLPDANWELKPQFAGEVLFLEWSATSPTARVRDGVDTFVFRHGLIQAQTVGYTLVTGD